MQNSITTTPALSVEQREQFLHESYAQLMPRIAPIVEKVNKKFNLNSFDANDFYRICSEEGISIGNGPEWAFMAKKFPGILGCMVRSRNAPHTSTIYLQSFFDSPSGTVDLEVAGHELGHFYCHWEVSGNATDLYLRRTDETYQGIREHEADLFSQLLRTF